MGFKGVYKDKSTAIKVSLYFCLSFFSLVLHTSLAVILISFFADNDGDYSKSRFDELNIYKLFKINAAFYRSRYIYYSHIDICLSNEF